MTAARVAVGVTRHISSTYRGLPNYRHLILHSPGKEWRLILTRTLSCEQTYAAITNSSDLSLSNDALRKHGILPPRPVTPPSPSPPPPPTLEERLDDLDVDELKDLAEDTKDDETARFIEHIRKQRLREVQRQEKARFGRVYPIGRDDYTREVTEASKVDSEDPVMAGKGTGVVCFLYKDG